MLCFLTISKSENRKMFKNKTPAKLQEFCIIIANIEVQTEKNE